MLDKLLQDIGTNKAKRCREIARIGETDFTGYLKLMAEQREVPTEAGLKRHAARAGKASGRLAARPRAARRSKAAGSAEAAPAILDCVQRVLNGIDVCVGDAKVKCTTRVSPNTLQQKQLRGNVFVSECLDPGEWLPKLAELRLKGGLSEVIVVLPDETGAEWFKALAADEWHCFFPTGNRGAPLLAYHGPRQRGFVLTFSKFGVVMQACAAESGES